MDEFVDQEEEEEYVNEEVDMESKIDACIIDLKCYANKYQLDLFNHLNLVEILTNINL